MPLGACTGPYCIDVVQCPCGMPRGACAGPFIVSLLFFAVPQGSIAREDAGTAERVAAKGQAQANLFQARPCHWVRAWHGGPRHQVRTQAFGRHVSHQTQFFHAVVYGTVLYVFARVACPCGRAPG